MIRPRRMAFAELLQGSPYTVVVLANQDPPAEVYATMPAVALVAERVKRERK